MFDTVLIANRGEIACRVIETARRLGLRTVAVYSPADRAARHVAMADCALPIGDGPAPADSYLRGEEIIAAARQSGAQAIHPGYGFLSENPDFVDQVAAAGLIFVGPSAEAIRAMGLKDAAKTLMERAGVPVVPGYHGANQDADFLARQAEEIGYPVLIKAVAGGGGKGMRLVEGAAGFADALDSARSEARTAFGNGDVLIEKFVQKPRHIEVQVFGDGRSAVHLFERDCSLQRRHQKVIEEAPAPGMSPQMRNAMGEAAVRAAEAIGYAGAGTVEFIVDASQGLRADRFWFMEMNTRLQVEHPVTEAITGVDLVEWQLRVAGGEPLPCNQDQLAINGHAFEARLYAEDVPSGFLPATGRLGHLRFAPGARADSGVRAGDTISPWYDPMITKVIVHGPTRALALQKLAQALRQTEVAGTVTNLAFLGALARHEGFAAGDVDTGLIGRDLAALAAAPRPEARHFARAALAALGVDAPGALTGFSLWAPLRQSVDLMQDETLFRVSLNWNGPQEIAYEVAALTGAEGQEPSTGAEQGCLRYDPLTGWGALGCFRAADEITVFDGYGLVFTRVDSLQRDAAASGDGSLIEAPMPGLVKAVFAKPGDQVEAGARLAILEAMKMEHTLVAARDGQIEEVLVSAGDQVSAGAALLRLAAESDAG